MRRFYLTVATLVVVPVIAVWPDIAFGQHHGHGGHHHHGGGWGGGWGGSGFGRVGPLLPYSSFGYGYSSFSGFGGLNYYHGPVGGVYAGPFGYGAPYGYTSFGYPNYGPYYSYLPMAPLVIQTQPLTIGPGLGDNPAIQEWMPKHNGQQPANPNDVVPPPQPRQQDVNVFVKPTTLEAKRKSIRYQAQGDEWFAKDNYLQAFARYKQAYSAAPDRPEPRFRMAVALASLNEFGPAVDELKRLVRMDPTWPSHGDRLDELFGEGHNLSKNAVLHRVSGWVREDVRDPDRLYLLGVLLHFNEDRDKAKTFFETASMLSGNPPHVRAYLTAPVAEAPAAKPAPPPAPLPLEEEEEPAPVPKPMAKPVLQKPAPRNIAPATPIVPKRELAGPKLLVPGEPVEDRPDGG